MNQRFQYLYKSKHSSENPATRPRSSPELDDGLGRLNWICDGLHMASFINIHKWRDAQTLFQCTIYLANTFLRSCILQQKYRHVYFAELPAS